jgi:hypothetical protein
MVQTQFSVYDAETHFRVHANSLEMTQTRTSVSDTETCFRVDLRYSLELAHIWTFVSDTETHFRVRHGDSFPCPTQKLVSLTVWHTIHCNLTSSAQSRRKLSEASTAVPSPSSDPLLCCRRCPNNTPIPPPPRKCPNSIAAHSLPTHYPQHPANSDERMTSNMS